MVLQIQITEIGIGKLSSNGCWLGCTYGRSIVMLFKFQYKLLIFTNSATSIHHITLIVSQSMCLASVICLQLNIYMTDGN